MMGVDPCRSASVKQVKIESVSAAEVAFSTRSASRTGDPHECLRRTFTVSRDEIHEDEITGAPPPVELTKDQVGTLYLSRSGWQTTSDNFHIHGVDRALFKYPTCAAATQRLLTQLSVVPSSIMVRGHLEGDHRRFHELELLGDDAADGQDLTWNGAEFLALELSQRGARRLGVKSRAVRLWPVWMTIKGSPEIDRDVSGEVDVLDIEMADLVQSLSFDTRGAPITLALTQDGVNAFHVTPEAVAELSSVRAAPCCESCEDQRNRHGQK